MDKQQILRKIRIREAKRDNEIKEIDKAIEKSIRHKRKRDGFEKDIKKLKEMIE